MHSYGFKMAPLKMPPQHSFHAPHLSPLPPHSAWTPCAELSVLKLLVL